MMNNTRWFGRQGLVRAAVTLILALCLCLSVLPAVPVSASAQDDALNKLVSWGVMNGYPDGGLHPNRAITRAEFVALVNRAYGYKETGNTPFLDVPYTAWYSDDISIAYNARYFDGTSATTAEPEANLTREQTMTLLARGMRLDSIPGEVTEFSDGRTFSTWSRGYVKAAYRKGLIGGYPDGSFKPLQNITRGEMAMLLSRALGNLVHEKGEHSLGSVYGNVTINTPNVTLYDTTIAGDLYITGGLGLGSVILDNVRVLGSIIVAGGGESEAGQDSVVLRNVRADELKIDSLTGQYLSVRAEGETVVTQTLVRTDAYIQDRTQAGKGLLDIALEGANGKYTLAGNLENVVNKAPGSTLKIARGTLGSLTIDETATGSKLEIYNDATVKEVNLDTAVNVTGGGDIGSLNVNTAGSSTSMLPDDINIRPGITANVYGESMDTTLGNEASSDPRILAGYPKATDVGPNTLTATVATNKSGTLYWAVSSITDGSVGEQELITPASYGSKAVKSGVLQVGKSNTDLKISVTGLTVGGNYYFSAVLVDARNDRSPVKVISFSTPDNTVPAFASSYPSLVLNSYYDKDDPDYPEDAPLKKYYAQFVVKSTKSCNLYWAVYTKGSTAPTAAEFRAQSLSGAVANSVEKANRNEDVFVTPKGLHELTDYDIYFWLCDEDGVKSSAVKKLTFKTIDGTPPEFNITPQHSAAPKATSISMTTNVNEAATVYWVAVLAGADYPADKPLNNTMDERDYKILQIVNGINGLKSGKVTVKANTDAAFTISGLKAETAYDIWYVAKDTAGNYSVFYTKADVAQDTSLTANYVTEHTLDTTAPTVTQEFSKHDTSGRPYPDTDIILTFSEDVLGVPISKYGGISLWELWELSLKEDAKAKADLTSFLKETIHLMCYTPDNEVERVGADVLKYDYDHIEITRASDGKGVVVRFKDAMLDSGTTYRFDLHDLADTSLANNTMAPPNPYPMDEFITVSSKIILTNLDNLVQTTINNGGDDEVIIADRYKGQEGDIGLSKDKDGKPVPIIIDAAFSLKPEATSREDPAKEWDMIIWCDTSVTFELYRRYKPSTPSTGSGGTGGGTGGDADAPSATAVTDDGINANPNKWEKLPGTWTSNSVDAKRNKGTGTITISSAEAGSFVGLSLFNSFDDFKATATSQRTNHFVKDLDEGATYEYAIHITNLDNSPEENRDSWSKDVTFQINIVAGTGLYNKLTGGTITEASYDNAINGDFQEVDDISESLKQRLPFQLLLHYEDSKPPAFATDEYPFFDRSDTSIKMTVQLKRKGTVYWYAAPVGSLLDAYKGDVTIQPTTVAQAVDPDDPTSFKLPNKTDQEEIKKAVNAERHLLAREVNTVFYSSDSIPPLANKGIPLSEPTNDRIYNPTNTHERIRFGSAVANTLAEITIPDLDPSTLYYIYIVRRGEAMKATSYSQVELFQVATTPPDSPILKLTNNLGDPNMGISTTDKDGNPMSSTVHYVIIPNTDDAKDDVGLNLPMWTDANNTLFDMTLIDRVTIESKYTEITDKGATTPRRYTVLDAMQENVYSQGVIIGTVFDRYASQDAKDLIMDYIIGSASGTESVVAGSSVAITERNPSVTVDCSEHPINAGTNYLFLAVAIEPQTAERGFSASPLLQTDRTAPALDELLYGGIVTHVDENGNYTLGGTITLMFDKDLYWLDRASNNRWNIYANDNLAADVKDGIVLKNTASTKTNCSFVTENAPSIVTRTITLELNDGVPSAELVFKTDICNASKIPDSKNRRLTINIEYDNKNVAYVVITYSDWKNSNPPISYRFLASSRVTTLTINKDATTLVPTKTEQLIAKVTSPTDEIRTVTWSTSNPAVATVSSTGLVTAKSEGVAIITASATNGTETISDSCTVTVMPGSISINDSNVTMNVGGTWPLTATVEPSTAKVTWSSSKTSVATVSNTGVVTAKAAGEATITASITVNNKTISATCTVKVLGPKFSLPASASVSAGSTINLTITPVNIDLSMIKSVEWYSTNYNIVTHGASNSLTVPDVRGVTGATGSAQIYAKITTTDGAEYTSDKCLVTVTSP